MLDFHVHLAGSGCCGSGIVLSKSFQRRPAFLALKFFQGISNQQMTTDIDDWWVRRIETLVEQAKAIEKAVVLCFDAVFTEQGERFIENTQLYVPNEWGAKVCENSQHLSLGGSVHPYRKDALSQLEWLKSKGVFLIKWLPSAMGIDPTHKLCQPFYEMLREYRIPLLSHVDTEYTFAALGRGWMQKNDVGSLENALKCGVTVIAAHAGTPTQTPQLVELMKRYENLYADSSGWFNPTRARTIPALAKMAKSTILGERLLFGSDWPVPSFAHLLADKIGIRQCSRIMAIKNPFDRDLELKEILGLPKSRFERNEKIFLEKVGRITA